MGKKQVSLSDQTFPHVVLELSDKKTMTHAKKDRSNKQFKPQPWYCCCCCCCLWLIIHAFKWFNRSKLSHLHTRWEVVTRKGKLRVVKRSISPTNSLKEQRRQHKISYTKDGILFHKNIRNIILQHISG